jgi:hypothetical protein
MTFTEKMWKKMSLDRAKNTLRWLEMASKYDNPDSIVGDINEMIIMGNQLQVSIWLTPSMMKEMLDYNRERLTGVINQLEMELKDEESK